MTDKDKLALIDKIVADTLEWLCAGKGNHYDAIIGTLYVMQTVLMFGEGEEDG